MEVHVRVHLPTLEGRQQILQIHSAKLRARGCLDAKAAAALGNGALAAATDSFSGAELAGLMRSASSFALERYVDAALLRGWTPGSALSVSQVTAGGQLEVTFADLQQALQEVEGGASGPRRRYFRRLANWRQRRRLASLARKAVAAADSADEVGEICGS